MFDIDVYMDKGEKGKVLVWSTLFINFIMQLPRLGGV